jgi:glutamine synthetase
MFTTQDELLKYIKDEGVEIVDVRFVDLPGIEQHFTVPVSSFDETSSRTGWLRRLLDPRLPGDQRVGHARSSPT